MPVPKPRLIEIGGKSWIVRPLRMIDLPGVEDILKDAETNNAKRSIALVQYFITVQHGPEAGSSFASNEGSWEELNTATRHCMEMTGYQQETESSAGEARAAESAAASMIASTKSTDA